MAFTGKRSERKCAVCRKTFWVLGGIRRYCGEMCRKIEEDRRREIARSKRPEGTGRGVRPCAICRKEFPSKSKRNVYCSFPCQQKGLAKAVEAQRVRRMIAKTEAPSPLPTNLEQVGSDVRGEGASTASE